MLLLPLPLPLYQGMAGRLLWGASSMSLFHCWKEPERFTGMPTFFPPVLFSPQPKGFSSSQMLQSLTKLLPITGRCLLPMAGQGESLIMQCPAPPPARPVPWYSLAFIVSVSRLFRMFKGYYYSHSVAVLLLGGGKLL